VPDKGTDFGALKSDYASLTPLNLDLTAADLMDSLKALFDDH
jgi:broad specificity polyphosphatase/5'/3'-nucleotidase SurE